MVSVVAVGLVATFVPMEWLAPGALLGIVFLMVMRGLLVPRAWLDEVKTDRDYWRESCKELTRQNGELIHGARVVEDVFRALPTQFPSEESAEGARRDG